jgi:hypothetical protein
MDASEKLAQARLLLHEARQDLADDKRATRVLGVALVQVEAVLGDILGEPLRPLSRDDDTPEGLL